MFGELKNVVFLQPQIERFSTAKRGALAQLARALAWHARGHRFDSVMLHKRNPTNQWGFLFFNTVRDSLREWNAIIELPAAGCNVYGLQTF